MNPRFSTRSKFKGIRLLLVSLALSLVVWMIFTWPLPQYLTEGIPSSSTNDELYGARAMIKGDQLQLYYHYWLFRDMLAGNTPWFYNLYEFNLGDDAERLFPTAYFFPISLLFSIGSLFGGAAFGVNLAGFVSIWLTFLFTAMLLRRFTRNNLAVVFGSLLAIAFPYRWVAQLGGSPGGYAMMYVPLVFLGLDIAVRSRKWTGGVVAGVGLLLACFGDVQVFFFTVLSVPVWCLIVAAADESPFHRFGRKTRGWAVSLAPVLVFLACAFGYRALLQQYIKRSVMGEGRTVEEVSINTPDPSGLFGGMDGTNNWHIYIGLTIGIFLFVAFLCQMMGIKMIDSLQDRMQSRYRLAMYVFVVCWILTVILLAVAFKGPLDGIVFRIVREVIHPYSFIRQPARIFCLMPTLLAVGCVLAFDTLGKTSNFESWKNYLIAGVGAAMLFDYASQVQATVCVLDREQVAYRAVIEDASAMDAQPHALAIPIWPGDSDWSSIYEYYASLYRLRMVNGYSPVVTSNYVNDVFPRYESMNQGHLTEGQIEGLRESGVTHVLVHENAFPEKVSPFPVRVTIDRFLRHPALELLAQDGSVWSFRIRPEKTYGTEGKRRDGALYCITAERTIDLTRHVSDQAMIVRDEAQGPERFARISSAGQVVRTRPWKFAAESDLRWSILVRGEGALLVGTEQDGIPQEVAHCDVKAPVWTWLDVPVNINDGFGTMVLELEIENGVLDVDLAYLGAGSPADLEPGESRAIAPADLFHAGYSTPDSGAVHFRRSHDPDQAILYGPNLPLAPGRYEMIVDVRSDAIRGLPLGILRSRSEGVAADPLGITESGRAVWNLTVNRNLPVRFEFVYARKADLSIDSILLRRLQSQE
jgi:hypothetical protein